MKPQSRNRLGLQPFLLSQISNEKLFTLIPSFLQEAIAFKDEIALRQSSTSGRQKRIKSEDWMGERKVETGNLTPTKIVHPTQSKLAHPSVQHKGQALLQTCAQHTIPMQQTVR